MAFSTLSRSIARLAGAAVIGSAVLVPQAGAASAAATLRIAPGTSWSSVLSKANPGDTVVVTKGTYPAQQLIGEDYRGVTVVGETRTGVVVRGLYLKDVKNLTIRNLSSAPVGSYDQGAAFKISYGSRNVTLGKVTAVPRTTTSTAGFDVSRGGATAPSGITISNSYYNGAYSNGSAGRGIRVWGGNVPSSQWPSNVKITGNTIVNSSADLIQIGGAKNVTISDNDLKSPKVTAEHNDGIQSYGSNGLTIADNTISAPGAYVGHDQGIIVGHSSPANNYLRVSNTRIEGNVVESWRGQGITLAGTAETVVTANTVKDLKPQASALVVATSQWNYTNTDASIYDNNFPK